MGAAQFEQNLESADTSFPQFEQVGKVVAEDLSCLLNLTLVLFFKPCQ